MFENVDKKIFIFCCMASNFVHSEFYQMHNLKTYPKLYNVSNRINQEFCEKNFPQHHDFADGIFSIGCCCELSITYGFEIMMAHESSRHFFKFLMNRKINMKNLEGVIFDLPAICIKNMSK